MRTGTLSLCAMLAACGQSPAPLDNAGAPEVPPRAPAAADQAATEEEARPAGPAPTSSQAATASPCRMQDGKAVTNRLKALGTEPFWAAEVDGRCVTYRTPEDQAGTRIWTKLEVGPQGPVWNGALNGRQFQLAVKPSTGCSDGMSDRTYPMEAVLRVAGETRKGCAEPL